MGEVKELTDKELQSEIYRAISDLAEESTSNIFALSIVYQFFNKDDELSQTHCLVMREQGSAIGMLRRIEEHRNEIISKG